MHQNVSLWSNGVHWVRSFRKIPMRLRFTNFCTSSACVVSSFVRQPNSTKCTRTSVWGPMGRIECVRCKKYPRDFVAQTFVVVRPVLHEFRKANKQSRMLPNHTNAPKHQFRVQWGGSGVFVAKKFRCDFGARTFALLRPVLNRVS